MTITSQSAGSATQQAADRKCLKYAQLPAAHEFQSHRPMHGSTVRFLKLRLHNTTGCQAA